jgi:hypothetical protein
MNNLIEYNNLKDEVKDKIKSVLYMYDKATVIYEYGRYNVSAHTALTSSHGDDFEFIGRYTRDDVYTKEEQSANRTKFLEETKNMDWEWFGA